MRLQAEHRFNGSPGEVAAFLTDPQFYAALVLPDVSQPEILESRADGPQSLLRVRYGYTGNLNSVARRVIGTQRLAWIQQVVLEHSANSGELTFHAEADPKRLHGSARFDLEAGDGGCVRRLAGELVVAVPLIGSRAERKLLPGVLRRLDIEAQGINNALARGRT